MTSITQAADQPVGGVDHVGITVLNLDASNRFFIDVLGFKVKGKDEKYPAVFLNNGQATITLWQVKDPKNAVGFDRKNNIGLHHLALTVESNEALDILYKKIKNYPGVDIEFAPELAYGGPDQHMMFYEPGGNRIELRVRSQAQ